MAAQRRAGGYWAHLPKESAVIPQAFRIAIFQLCVCVLAAPAFAQQGGARVAGSFAGTFGEGETNVAAGGSVGYRFTPHVGFELEAFALPDLEFDDTGDGGRGVAFLTNFVAEFPSPVRWLTPYVQGGGGVANVSNSRFAVPLDFPRIDPPVISRRDPRRPTGRLVGRQPQGGDAGDFAIRRGPSETSVALSVGGGVDFTVWRGLAIGPSISYLKLFGNAADRDLTRIGLRTSYRF